MICFCFGRLPRFSERAFFSFSYFSARIKIDEYHEFVLFESCPSYAGTNMCLWTHINQHAGAMTRTCLFHFSATTWGLSPTLTRRTRLFHAWHSWKRPTCGFIQCFQTAVTLTTLLSRKLVFLFSSRLLPGKSFELMIQLKREEYDNVNIVITCTGNKSHNVFIQCSWAQAAWNAWWKCLSFKCSMFFKFLPYNPNHTSLRKTPTLSQSFHWNISHLPQSPRNVSRRHTQHHLPSPQFHPHRRSICSGHILLCEAILHVPRTAADPRYFNQFVTSIAWRPAPMTSIAPMPFVDIEAANCIFTSARNVQNNFFFAADGHIPGASRRTPAEIPELEWTCREEVRRLE